jgi:hypothetical protein
MDGTRAHYVKKNKPDKKTNTECTLSYIEYKTVTTSSGKGWWRVKRKLNNEN